MTNDDPNSDRALLMKCFDSAIRAVMPSTLLTSRLTVDKDSVLEIKSSGLKLDLTSYDKVLVVGCGKAAGSMAETLEQILDDQIRFEGCVNILKGTTTDFKTSKIKLNESTHPIPSALGVSSTEKIVKVLRTATQKSLVICLISGGGSSMMPLPAEGISLDDKVKTTTLLLESGASISEVNCVRKHLSAIKGGQLPLYANGAALLSLIISDVVDDPLESIASGPTTPDPTTFRDALSIIERYDLENLVPERVNVRLKAGAAGTVPETPKPDDPRLESVTNYILGDNGIACDAAIRSLKEIRGIAVYYLGSSWEGEARKIGGDLASLCIAALKHQSGFATPAAFVWGGETTVTVKGKGRGGRNQEEAMGALSKIKSMQGITIGFMGTDGKDGFSDAAGAIVDFRTWQSAIDQRLDPESYLGNNDSTSFFENAGRSLLFTGPTGTNVNDIGLALIG